jgi:hypothetical protein
MAFTRQELCASMNVLLRYKMYQLLFTDTEFAAALHSRLKMYTGSPLL